MTNWSGLVSQGKIAWNTHRINNPTDVPDLSDQDVSHFDVSGFDFSGGIYHRTLFKNQDNRSRIQETQFSGADLTDAVLPDSVNFEIGLGHITDTSKTARLNLFFLTAGCVLAIGASLNISDLQVVTGKGGATIPFPQVTFPLTWYNYLTPLAIFAFYVFFHLYLQSLWERIGKMPAVFPDCRPLDERVFSCLINLLVRRYAPRLTCHDKNMKARTLLSVFITWWMAPLSLVLLWFLNLRFQSLSTTCLYLLIVFVTGCFGFVTHKYAKAKLGNVSGALSLRWGKERFIRCVYALVFLMVTYSGGHYFLPCQILPGLNVEKDDVSQKLPTWQHELELLEKANAYSNTQMKKFVKEADLSGRRLRFMDAKGAFMLGANLKGADLFKVNFSGGNLATANLMHADLRRADLQDCDLANARLDYALMNNADFKYDAAKGKPHSMEYVDFSGTKLGYWSFDDLILNSSKFTGATSEESINFSKSKLNNANFDSATLNVRTNFNSCPLQEASFKNAKFASSDFTGSDISNAIFDDACLTGATFKYSIIRGTRFDRADLSYAIFDGAIFSGKTTFNCADLTDAEFTSCRGLTAEMFQHAIINKSTVLPEGISIEPQNPCQQEPCLH